jgi:hypothetical protein
MKLSDKINIANELLGSCASTSDLVDKYELDFFEGAYEIEKAANDCGVWLCDICGWWYDESEIHEYQPEVICETCNKFD